MVKMVWVFGQPISCFGRFKKRARHVLGRFPRVGAVIAPLSHNVDAAAATRVPGHALLAAVADSPSAWLPHLTVALLPRR